MTCESIKVAPGVVAIVCQRGKRWPMCAFCKTRNSATLLCDGPKGDGKTCDAKCCAVCAVHVGADLDFCPNCASAPPVAV